MPKNHVVETENLVAIETRAVLVGTSPVLWLLRGMPRALFVVTGVALTALVLSVYGSLGEKSFNLTASESAEFALIFARLVLFICFLVAMWAALEAQPVQYTQLGRD